MPLLGRLFCFCALAVERRRDRAPEARHLSASDFANLATVESSLHRVNDREDDKDNPVSIQSTQRSQRDAGEGPSTQDLGPGNPLVRHTREGRRLLPMEVLSWAEKWSTVSRILAFPRWVLTTMPIASLVVACALMYVIRQTSWSTQPAETREPATPRTYRRYRSVRETHRNSVRAAGSASRSASWSGSASGSSGRGRILKWDGGSPVRSPSKCETDADDESRTSPSSPRRERLGEPAASTRTPRSSIRC